MRHLRASLISSSRARQLTKVSTTAEQLAQAGQFAAAYIEKKWGGPSRTVPLVAVVILASTPIRALQNNPRRMAWTLINPSGAQAFIGHSASDAALNAIPVTALGGSVVSTVDEDGEEVTYELWVNSVSAITVYVTEVMRK